MRLFEKRNTNSLYKPRTNSPYLADKNIPFIQTKFQDRFQLYDISDNIIHIPHENWQAQKGKEALSNW
jgi:hypothetical protein